MNFTKRSLYRIFLCLVLSAFASVAGAHRKEAATADTMPHPIQDNPSGLTAEFDKLIASESNSTEPGGVMLVAQKGQIIYRKAFGMASEADPKGNNKSPRGLVDAYKNQPIEFAAGTKWNYNNTNYYLLGYIVEKLSGKSYARYMTENIFNPAGMKNTCFCTIDTVIKNKASGYINGRIGIVNDRISSMNTLYSSGGLQSTAEDMFRWNQAIKTNILVKKETMARAFTSFKLNDGQDIWYQGKEKKEARKIQ